MSERLAGQGEKLSVSEQALCARRAARKLTTSDSAQRSAALHIVAKELEAAQTQVLAANARDMQQAEARGVRDALLDRLLLTPERVAQMSAAVREIAELVDPVGQIIEETVRPNGVRVRRVRVPLGVIGMVYEARPNVTIEAAALTLKTGNAVLLRGGSEAAHSNAALGEVLARALQAAQLPVHSAQIIAPGGHDGIRELVQCSEHVDLVIPRGGEALIRFVTEHARVPVVLHYKGVCHAFLDEGAELAMAQALLANAKLQRPSACNALEGLLVARSECERLLQPLAAALIAAGTELRGCAETLRWVPAARAAAPEDFGREHLDPVLTVKVVADLDEALAYIAQHGSGHSELIITGNAAHAERFLREVDAACVLHNASTRFHDGGQLGLGAELGIATSRLHWRGPMGLEALTSMKWLVQGEGQIRS